MIKKQGGKKSYVGVNLINQNANTGENLLLPDKNENADLQTVEMLTVSNSSSNANPNICVLDIWIVYISNRV